MILYINSYVKHSSPLWPLSTPKDHNWYKFESTLLENEDLSMHSCVRIRPPPSPPRFWPILPLGIMICQNLYLLYLMLPRKVSSLLAECVLERRYLKTFLNIVLCINSNPLF